MAYISKFEKRLGEFKRNALMVKLALAKRFGGAVTHKDIELFLMKGGKIVNFEVCQKNLGSMTFEDCQKNLGSMTFEAFQSMVKEGAGTLTGDIPFKINTLKNDNIYEKQKDKKTAEGC